MAPDPKEVKLALQAELERRLRGFDPESVKRLGQMSWLDWMVSILGFIVIPLALIMIFR